MLFVTIKKRGSGLAFIMFHASARQASALL
jgi:hypothetical protein